MHNHVVIASVPWTDTSAPLMAPAILKSVLMANGISATAIDLNAESVNKINSNPFKDEIVKFLLTEQVTAIALDEIYSLFDWMVDRIMSSNPNWVCLSLLTYLSQISTRWLCLHLKQRYPEVKIIIGGPGCFNTLKSIDTYAMNLRKQRLIDHFISGDGEESLPALIKGNDTYPGVNTNYWKELSNLDNLPPPDYDDYDWNLYTLKKVSIWGSRGCVQNCTFCDIHEHWSKFQWRTAESIFNEMKFQNQKYGINMFHFADSLVNGNQKEYRNLIKLLADYNMHQPADKKISWSGFFIFRAKEQMKEEDWRLTAASGGEFLAVGVESFVDHIRKHMNKHFTNEDLEYGLDMCKKYNLTVNMLLIVGYVTETQQDHDEQIAWIKSHSHYARSPVVITNVGSGLGILPGTPLDSMRDSLGIKLTDKAVFQDWTRPDINSTPQLRMQWHKETFDTLRSCGFNPVFQKDNQVLIEEYLAKK